MHRAVEGPDEGLTTNGATRRRILALSSLAHFVNDGTGFFVPVIAALFTGSRPVSPLEIALMFAVYYLSASLLSPSVGHLADRSLRLGSLVALGVALLGLGLLGFYASLAWVGGGASYAIALPSAFVVGFGSAFYHPIGATLLQRAYSARERGRALGINGALGSAGRAAYPLIFFAVGLYAQVSSSLLLFVVVAGAAAVVIDRGLASRRTGSPPARPAVSSARQAVTRGIVLLTAVAFVRSVATQGIVAWIPTLLVTRHDVVGPSGLGLAVGVMYLAGILGQPFFGVLADRADRRLLLALSAIGSALTTLGYLLTSGDLSLVFLALIGFFTFSAFPLLMSLSAEFVHPQSSSLANALVFGLGAGGGGALGPVIVGALAYQGYSHLPLGFEVMVGIGLASAVAVLAIPKEGAAARMPLFG